MEIAKGDEVIIIVDTALQQSRLGAVLIKDGPTPEITSNVTNMLCVILTGPQAANVCGNGCILERLLKYMEVVSSADTELASLWQCYVKVLAKNTSAPDELRIASLILLLDRLCAVTGDSSIFSKLCQYLKIVLKLSKYALKRIPLDSKSVELVSKILPGILPNDQLLCDLLSLPIRITDSPEVEIEKRLKTLVISANVQSEGTIGGFLTRRAQEFSISSPLIKWFHETPKPIGSLASLLGLILGNTRLESSKGTFVDLLVNLLLLGDQRILIGSILRKILLANPPSSLGRMSRATKFVLCAHLCCKSFPSNIKDLFAEARKLVALISDPLLVYWPIACMVNITKEQPQPSRCSELLLALHAKHALLPSDLLGNGILASLKFLESKDVPLIKEMITALPPHIQMRIVAYSAVNSIHCFESNELAQIFQNASKATRIERIDVLQSCELFLRFSPDVSVLETPNLTDFQFEIISFLKRELASANPEFVKDSLTKRQMALKTTSLVIPSSGKTAHLSVLAKLQHYLESIQHDASEYNKLLESINNLIL